MDPRFRNKRSTDCQATEEGFADESHAGHERRNPQSEICAVSFFSLRNRKGGVGY